MAWLPNGEKNFEDIFIRFGATHERDGQTDGHRVTAIAALCTASHRKKYDDTASCFNTVPKHDRQLMCGKNNSSAESQNKELDNRYVICMHKYKK